jgi:hypothetical protein
MLQHQPFSRCAWGLDLQFRVHFLRIVCRQRARPSVSELRRRARAKTYTSWPGAAEQPCVEPSGTACGSLPDCPWGVTTVSTLASPMRCPLRGGQWSCWHRMKSFILPAGVGMGVFGFVLWNGGSGATESASTRMTSNPLVPVVEVIRPVSFPIVRRLPASGRIEVRGDHIEWSARVPVHVLSRLREGALVVVSVGNGEQVSGRIAAIEPADEAFALHAMVRASLPLHPGLQRHAFAVGRFDADAVDALVLPAQAVRLHDAASFVYVLDKDNTARAHPIAQGERFGGLVEVLNLSARQRVVSNGVGPVVDGGRVLISPASADGGRHGEGAP